jgi:pimeloyl-ACP methyl ester carboxylesterase
MGVAVRGWLAAVACAFAALTFGAGFGEPAIADDLGTPYATSATTARLAVKRGLVAIDPPGHPRVNLYAEESGHGETLVLLHGLGASGYTFRRIVPDLARRYRVVTVDLKGHGRSDKPFDLNYSPHDQAVFIYWFLRAYGLDRVTLIGHSFGGQVALNLALLVKRYDPDRIRRLVLMSAPAYPQPFTSAVSLLRKPVLPYIALTLIPREVPIAIALMTEAVGLGLPVTRQDVDIYAQPYADAGARHAVIQTARQIVPDNANTLVNRYPSITKPTLVIWCRDDHVVPVRSGQRLARALPRARLKLLSRCDHVPPEQRPREVVRLIRGFVK